MPCFDKSFFYLNLSNYQTFEFDNTKYVSLQITLAFNSLLFVKPIHFGKINLIKFLNSMRIKSLRLLVMERRHVYPEYFQKISALSD